MPIDKFGRHMLRDRSVPYSPPTITSSPDSSPFYICEPKLHHSKCVINLRGHSTKTGMYILENNKDEYVFPISGKLESLEIVPATCQMFLNGGTALTSIELIGTNINKGDKINFITVSKQPSLYVEIVLQCPITKNV